MSTQPTPENRPGSRLLLSNESLSRKRSRCAVYPNGAVALIGDDHPHPTPTRQTITREREETGEKIVCDPMRCDHPASCGDQHWPTDCTTRGTSLAARARPCIRRSPIASSITRENRINSEALDQSQNLKQAIKLAVTLILELETYDWSSHLGRFRGELHP